MLSNLRHEAGDARLTARTQRLLMLETLPDVQTFIETHRVFPLKRQTVVTCIDTLNKVSFIVLEKINCYFLSIKHCLSVESP